MREDPAEHPEDTSYPIRGETEWKDPQSQTDRRNWKEATGMTVCGGVDDGRR